MPNVYEIDPRENLFLWELETIKNNYQNLQLNQDQDKVSLFSLVVSKKSLLSMKSALFVDNCSQKGNYEKAFFGKSFSGEAATFCEY